MGGYSSAHCAVGMCFHMYKKESPNENNKHSA